MQKNKKFVLLIFAGFLLVITLTNISAFCVAQGYVFNSTGSPVTPDLVYAVCTDIQGGNTTLVQTVFSDNTYGLPFGGLFDTCSICDLGIYVNATNSTLGAYGEVYNKSSPTDTFETNITIFGAPGPTVTIVTPTSNYVYSTATRNYDATCVVGDGSVSEVIFTSNHTGVHTNYSYNAAQVTNPSGSTFRYVMPSLAAGTSFVYRWFCNQTTGGLFDVDGPQAINVTKSTASCDVLFNTTSPKTYPYSVRVWSNCNSAITLYRNGTSIANNSAQNLSVGTYNFTVIRTDQVNFSNIYDTEYFVIQQATGVVYAYVNNTRANITIENGSSIWLNATLPTGSGSIKLYKNGTLINQGTSPLSNYTLFSSPGLYNISATYDGNTNYTADIETWYVNVTSDNNPPYFTLIPANASLNYGQSLNVDFNAVDAEGHFSSFIVNDTRFSINSTGGLVNATSLLVGVYVMNVSINDTAGNYNWTLYRVTVNALTSPCDVLFNTTSPKTYPASFRVYSNCNSAFVLYRNGSVISNNSEQALAAGTYNFTVIRNDTVNYTNFYDNETFIIQKASASLDIAVTPSNTVTYPTQTTANGTGCPIGLTCNLYRNNSGVSNPDVATLVIGTYNYTYNTSGNENYSAASYSEIVNVIQNASTCQVLFNTTSPKTYPASFRVYTDCTSAYVLYRNGTVIANNSEQSLAAGTYNFTVVRNDTVNYSNIYDTEYFVIQQATPSLSISILPSNSVEYPTQTNASGSGCPLGLTCNFYRNNSGVSNPDVQTLPVGTYGYKYNTTGNQNYSSASVSDTLAVTLKTSPCNVSFNTTSPKTYPASFRVYTNCDSAFVLYRNGTVVGNNSEQTLAAGTYNFSVIRNDTENYTNVYDSKNFVIQQATPTLNYYLNGVTSNANVTYPSAINASASVDIGTLAIYRNASDVTGENNVDVNLSAGYYRYDFNVTGNENYSSVSHTLYANVNQFVTVLDIVITPENVVQYPTFTSATATGCPSAIACSFYRDNSMITDPDNVTLGAGNYNYTINTSGNENYTSDSYSEILEVSQNGSNCAVLFNTTSPKTYPASFIVYTNCNTAYTLYRNGSSIANGSEQTLAAGTYNFSVIRDDNQNYTNVYDEENFVIQQATGEVYCYLNASRSNLVIEINEYADLNATINVPATGNVLLYSNNTLINQGANTIFNVTQFSSYGSFNITAFYSGNENYTGDFETWYVIVNDSTSPQFTSINNMSVYHNESVYQDIDATDSSSICFYVNDSDFSINCDGILQNATILSIGMHWLNITVNDSFGNKNSSVIYVNVSEYPDNVPPYFITIPDNASLNYGQSLNVDFNAVDAEGHFDSFSVNDSRFSINSTGGLVNSSSLSIGTYILNVSINDTLGNYNWTLYQVIVSASTSNCDVLFNTTSPKTYPASFRVYTNCNSAYVLYRNGSVISNNSEQALGVGTYNFSVIRNDTVNYSNSYDEEEFEIQQATGVVYAYINTSRSNLTIQNGTYANLSAVLNNGSGSIKLYINDTLINQGTGTIYNNTLFDTLGLYNISAVYDGNENYSSDIETWWLNVSETEDTEPPVFTDIANINVNLGSLVYYDINASDSSGIGCFGVNDSNFVIDCDGILQNATSLIIGVYWLNITVNDSLGNEASQIIYVNVTRASSGGGGGGGGTPEEEVFPFEVIPDAFVMDIVQGEDDSFTFVVTNKLNEPLQITVDYGALANFVSINPNDLVFTLQAGESNYIDVDVSIPLETLPDSYFGKIVVRGDGERKDVDIIINVKELLERALFDISTKMVTRRVAPGSDAIANIDLTNLGNIGKVEVTVHYLIIDFENNTIAHEQENLVIGDNAVVRRSLFLPETETDVNYAFYARVDYPGGSASSADTFTTSPLPNWMLFLIALILIIVSAIVTMVLYQRNVFAVGSG